MFYEQLFRAKKIPKAQKDSQVSNIFFALLGSLLAKVTRKHVGEIDPISRHID